MSLYSDNCKKIIGMVLPLNELQSLGCLMLVLEVEDVKGGKHCCQSRLESRLDPLKDSTAFDAHHPSSQCLLITTYEGERDKFLLNFS